MKARTITFTQSVRCSPKVTGWRDKLRLDDRDFEGGSIEVQVKERVVVIRNPATDPQTSEPLETMVPMDRVVCWEPLSDKQAEAYGKKTEAA